MKTQAFIILFTILIFPFNIFAQTSQPNKGRWKLLKKSIGISAMHMALLPNDRVISFDRTDFGPSNISLPQGKCRHDKKEQVLTTDCYAHSIEFDPSNRNVRPLTLQTDTWCSTGSLLPDGVLVQSGGFNDGDKAVRFFKPCNDCDWEEVSDGLVVRRWYASNQILPDGRIIIVGGRQQFSYEFIPKSSVSDYKAYQLSFLKETTDSEWAENNLYPFTHLSTDGNLFIFANNRAILLDYMNNRIVKNYPAMPGGFARNYPSTGSSVLLPLIITTNKTTNAEVLICGGTPPESNFKANAGIFLPAANSCGRIIITAANPKWVMEKMPFKRVMGDMILLPTGDVLIINGAAKGTAGWGVGREPVLHPVLYQPSLPSKRFKVLNPSLIPRLYHSTALLLADGRILVAGSNPNWNYNFSALYPTELSLEAFFPPYLSSDISRPRISCVKPNMKLRYKQKFTLSFELKKKGELEKIYVTMVAPAFTTHSFSMNQRVLVLVVDGVRQISDEKYVVESYAPATAALAPPGYYLLFVVHGEIPSPGKWVHIKQ